MYYVKRVNSDKTMCVVDTEDNSHDECTIKEVLNFNKLGITILGLEFAGSVTSTKFQSMFNIGGIVFAIKKETNTLLTITEGTHAVNSSTKLQSFSSKEVAGKFDVDEKTQQVEVIQALELGNGQYVLNFGEMYRDKDDVTRLKCTAYLYNDVLGYIKKLISTKFSLFPKCVYPSLVKTSSGAVYFGKKVLDLTK